MTALPEVVRATVRGVPDVVIFRRSTKDDHAWASPDDVVPNWWLHREKDVTDRRPLVLIDPEDAEQVEQFCKVYRERPGSNRPWSGERASDKKVIIADLQAALRSLAEPTPPEPQGQYVVVEEEDGTEWVKLETALNGASWQLLGQPYAQSRFATWDEIAKPVKVLSEGVTP